MAEYKNVSVRLDKKDFDRLEELHKIFDTRSIGKVSFADVCRLALDDLYRREITDKTDLQQEVKEEVKEIVKEVTEEAKSEEPSATEKPKTQRRQRTVTKKD